MSWGTWDLRTTTAAAFWFIGIAGALASPRAHAFLGEPPAPLPEFYRIVDGPRPDPAQVAIDTYLYGARILYTDDARLDDPTFVDGTVWQGTSSDARLFVGTLNPVIASPGALKRIEYDKWAEAVTLMRVAPESFPRTERMDAYTAGGADLDRLALLKSELQKEYGEGFFLKPVSSFAAAGTFPSEGSDWARAYTIYLAEIEPKIRAMRAGGLSPAEIHLKLRDRDGYEGRVLADLLRDPTTVLVQSKIQPSYGSIDPRTGKARIQEYRVHVVSGTVLSGATQHRWEDYRILDAKKVGEIEAFVQDLIERLPPGMRKLCYGVDVMIDRDGFFRVIELNPGGESGYLFPEIDLWVTQLLAKHFRGRTEFLDEFEAFKTATSWQERERKLTALLSRAEIKHLTLDGRAPIDEVLFQAKNVVLAAIEQKPRSINDLRQGLRLIRRFELAKFLSGAEIERLAQSLDAWPAARDLADGSYERLFNLQTGEALGRDAWGTLKWTVQKTAGRGGWQAADAGRTILEEMRSQSRLALGPAEYHVPTKGPKAQEILELLEREATERGIHLTPAERSTMIEEFSRFLEPKIRPLKRIVK